MFYPSGGVAVEITERRVPAPPEVQQQRADVAHRLDQLGQINEAEGTVATDVSAGYELRINGVPVLAPVVGYEVVAGEHGPMVMVTIPADSLSIGTKPPASTPDHKAARVWGVGQPDPREDIPGWTPEVEHG